MTTQNIQVKFTLLAGIDADKAAANQRVCRIVYKENKKTGVKKDSLGAIIPVLAAEDTEALLANATVKEWIMDKFLGVQDTLVRAALESSQDNSIVLPNVDAIKAAIVKEMETSSERTRLSGDSIKKWVTSSGLADSLAAAFAERLGLEPKAPKVLGVVGAYAENIALLAGKSPLPEQVMVNIIKALDMAPDDSMKDKLLGRVEVLTSVDLDAMLAL